VSAPFASVPVTLAVDVRLAPEGIVIMFRGVKVATVVQAQDALRIATALVGQVVVSNTDENKVDVLHEALDRLMDCITATP